METQRPIWLATRDKNAITGTGLHVNVLAAADDPRVFLCRQVPVFGAGLVGYICVTLTRRR